MRKYWLLIIALVIFFLQYRHWQWMINYPSYLFIGAIIPATLIVPKRIKQYNAKGISANDLLLSICNALGTYTILLFLVYDCPTKYIRSNTEWEEELLFEIQHVRYRAGNYRVAIGNGKYHEYVNFSDLEEVKESPDSFFIVARGYYDVFNAFVVKEYVINPKEQIMKTTQSEVSSPLILDTTTKELTMACSLVDGGIK